MPNTMNELLPEKMRSEVCRRVEAMKTRGGPTVVDFKRAQETFEMLGEKGDVLLYGGGKPGEYTDLFDRTAKAYSVMAFVPGGVTVFGVQVEVKPTGNEEVGRG
jgi:hypothetical protein